MLSDTQVKNLKPKEKRYSMADGEGLIISIFPTGKKKWVLAYVSFRLFLHCFGFYSALKYLHLICTKITSTAPKTHQFLDLFFLECHA